LDHPNDREHAKRAIAKLEAEGCLPDADEIRRWAQRYGWDAGAAAELAAIAKKA
jgi:hypothetical protein